MATNYSRGADFERRVGRDIESHGYMWVRSSGSHKPADLVALKSGEVIAIQCKRDGRLGPQEWNKFLDWCELAGAIPVVASKGPRGSGIIYHRLTSSKDGRGRQPWVFWTPQKLGE